MDIFQSSVEELGVLCAGQPELALVVWLVARCGGDLGARNRAGLTPLDVLSLPQVACLLHNVAAKVTQGWVS